MKYRVGITGWGEEALMMIDKLLILFNDDAPQELKEVSVLCSKGELLSEPTVGDSLLIGECAFEIQAIGSVALNTLRELGHCTLMFTEVACSDVLPGAIYLKGNPITMADITVGTVIEIY